VEFSALPRRRDRSLLPHDGTRDFDFLLGCWRVHNRRLLQPCVDSDGWIEFEGRSEVRALAGCCGNLEDWEAYTPAGRVSAVSLHLYDPRAGQWRLHWAAGDDGRLGVATVGSFVGRRGEFYGWAELEDRAVLLRRVWEPSTPDACRLEQAFSEDGGRSWEITWIMDFTREA
jgi:hypothetical protein